MNQKDNGCIKKIYIYFFVEGRNALGHHVLLFCLRRNDIFGCLGLGDESTPSDCGGVGGERPAKSAAVRRKRDAPLRSSRLVGGTKTRRVSTQKSAASVHLQTQLQRLRPHGRDNHTIYEVSPGCRVFAGQTGSWYRYGYRNKKPILPYVEIILHY